MGINTQSTESHLGFAESVAPDVTFLSDLDGSVSQAYGISPMERGYFIINANRELHYQFVALAVLLENQTATLLMEIDKMTGNYTGNPDDYTSGGLLVNHDDDGKLVGNHAVDFSLQAQCGATITLYNQLKLHENGIAIAFFRNTNSRDAKAMFSEFKTNIDRFQSRGIGIIGISGTRTRRNMSFAESLGVEGREIIFFHDENGDTGKDYGVYKEGRVENRGRHETAYFLLDRNGVIRYKHVGSALDNQTQTLFSEMDHLGMP